MCPSCHLQVCIGHCSPPQNLQRWQHKLSPPNYNCLAELIKKIRCQLHWPILLAYKFGISNEKKVIFKSLIQGFLQVTENLVNIRNASDKGNLQMLICCTHCPSGLFSLKTGMTNKPYLVLGVPWFCSILSHAKALFNSHENENDSYCQRKMMLSKILFFKFFWPCRAACSILVPSPGIKPEPPSMEAWSLNPQTARKVQKIVLTKW